MIPLRTIDNNGGSGRFGVFRAFPVQRFYQPRQTFLLERPGPNPCSPRINISSLNVRKYLEYSLFSLTRAEVLLSFHQLHLLGANRTRGQAPLFKNGSAFRRGQILGLD